MSDEALPPPDALPPDAAVIAAVPVPGFEPAGFWVRGGAVLIDALLLGPVGGLLGWQLLRHGVPAWERFTASLLLGGAYKVLMIGRWGQTVGKMAAGVEVRTADGEKVGYGRATARYLATFLSSLPLNGGFVVAAFTERKRALHDYVAGTRVVFRPGVGRGRRALMTFLGVLFPLSFLALGVFLGRKVFLPLSLVRDATRHEHDMEFDQAEGDYTRLIALDPKNASYWNGRCWDRALLGKDLDAAMADCEQSLRLKVMPANLDSRGMVFLKMKKYKEALASYDSALKLDSKLPPSLYGRGLAKRALGDKEGSAADGRAAAALDPDISVQFRQWGTDLLDE